MFGGSAAVLCVRFVIFVVLSVVLCLLCLLRSFGRVGCVCLFRCFLLWSAVFVVFCVLCCLLCVVFCGVFQLVAAFADVLLEAGRLLLLSLHVLFVVFVFCFSCILYINDIYFFIVFCFPSKMCTVGVL